MMQEKDKESLYASNEDYINFMSYIESQGLSFSTVKLYEYLIRFFISKQTDLSKIEEYNEFIVANCIDKKNYALYQIIRKFIKWHPKIKNKNIILDNLRPIKLLPSSKKPIELNKKELNIIISHLEDEKHKLLSMLQTYTGARVGDLLRLKIENIFEDDKNAIQLITTGKGGKKNIFYLFDKDVKEFLNYYINKRKDCITMFKDYLFLDTFQKKNDSFGGDIKVSKTKEIRALEKKEEKKRVYLISRQMYDKYMIDLRKASLLAFTKKQIKKDIREFTSHDYRRCFASRAWEQTGNDLEKTMRLMNHTRFETTLRYIKDRGLDLKQMHKMMQEEK